MTEFVDLLAVEAWDAWFRWRERGELRDTTIDATWQRVAGALGAAQGARAADWSRRCIDAFSQWRLLPDEALLRAAGTGVELSLPEQPGAVLNLAMFVRAGTDGAPRVDTTRLQATAGLAVELLDHALALTGRSTDTDLAVGVIGLADALQRLGLDYDSEAARSLAATLVQAVAFGCRAARSGRASAALTAVAPQPRLAMLANCASDALDPAPGIGLQRPGFGLDAIQAPRASHTHAAPPPSPAAQLRMRAAVQPWIDAPIDYPLLLSQAPDARLQADLAKQARSLGLSEPRWTVAASRGAD
ncbi:MAG TPA: hypothetical protein VFY12_04470 [Arenimonas sp.]|nr:hypothetical protein [Arenimonas sp.]